MPAITANTRIDDDADETLSEALASLGLRHAKSEHYGCQRISDALDGDRDLGVFDYTQGWALVRARRAAQHQAYLVLLSAAAPDAPPEARK